MQFVHQALTWGFLLALVPVLIHLINMMRHKRVQWAAMDFLLQSYKKHRRWVWLKQLLLLLARMAAIALLVAMLAQWVTQRQFLRMFGGAATHHYVLVDDSFSMSDRAGGASAFDLARQVVDTIARRAAESDVEQRLTLIRYSQAARAARDSVGDSGSNSGTKNGSDSGTKNGSNSGTDSSDGDAATRLAFAADFNASLVDANFQRQFEEKYAALDASTLAVGPQPALELVRQLLDGGTGDTPIVYLVSDFRAGQWSKPAELKELLLATQRSGATIELVQCAKSSQANLAVTDIQPADETRAAGVPLFVNVTVRNFGAVKATKVPLKVRTIYTPPETVLSGDAERAWDSVEELPATILEEIAPGASLTRRLQVYFAKPGTHVVEAELPDDAVAADNRRWSVIEFPANEPVLLVDGTAEQRAAYYLAAVFQPGERARTGIQADIKTPAFLRDATAADLAAYRAIYLLDVARIDDSAVKNLEQFAEAGGGVAFFAGPNTNLRFVTERLYRNGEGLFPLPLEREDLLPPPIEEGTPDLEVNDHPVFAPFIGERNPFVRWVNIERFVRPPADWKPPAGSPVVVAAQLRGRIPLVVETRKGRGRVLAFLTSLTPDWNNWAQDPSFIVMLLRLQSHLAADRRPADARVVGAPLEIALDAGKFSEDLRWVVPGAKRGARVPLDRTAARQGGERLEAKLGVGGSGGSTAGSESTDRPGVYEAWPKTAAGGFELRRFALNVDPEEGDLALVEGQTLLANLAPLRAEYQLAEQFQASASGDSGVNRSLLLMAALIALLLGEQFLAYLLSYHPPAAAGAAAAGSAQGLQAGSGRRGGVLRNSPAAAGVSGMGPGV